MIRLSGVITYSFPMQDTFPFPWLAVYQNIDIPLSIADLSSTISCTGHTFLKHSRLLNVFRLLLYFRKNRCIVENVNFGFLISLVTTVDLRKSV